MTQEPAIEFTVTPFCYYITHTVDGEWAICQVSAEQDHPVYGPQYSTLMEAAIALQRLQNGLAT